MNMTETETTSDTIKPKIDYEEAEEESGKCPECGSKDFYRDEARGEVYCVNCGSLVDDNRIDTSKEYRVFDSDDKTKERVGSSITYTKADKGMSTKIGENAEMNKVSGKKRGQYYRMKKWDSRSGSRQDSIQEGLSILDRLTFELKLPTSVKEEAGRLYEKCVEEDLIQGKEREAAVAALIYLVSRNQELPRTQKEISEAAKVKERKMNRAYRSLARELGLNIRPAKPENFVSRYSSDLGLEGKVEAKARNLVVESREAGITSGKSPVSIAAAGIYIASMLGGDEITQNRVAEETGVTSTTIRKTYREIVEGLEIEDEVEEKKNG
jgi:transcription initiation factor TFIIB